LNNQGLIEKIENIRRGDSRMEIAVPKADRERTVMIAQVRSQS
jgi:hypothetical protein